MECQNDHALSLLPPIPGEYHYEVVGCGYGWMSLGLKTLRSARNLMQNTLDFDVINPVDSQHVISRVERERSLDHTWITALGHICLQLVQQV